MANSVQLNVDDDTFRRLRVRTGSVPVSFAAGDEDRLRCEVSNSPYYSLLARAVLQLPKNTRTARVALYDRAEVALNTVLLHPEISDEQATFERLAFGRVIRKIENDALARVALLRRISERLCPGES